MAAFDFVIGLAALSALLTWMMIRVRILDLPNQRSSHDRPVPRAGGMAIVIAFFIGLSVVGPWSHWGLAVAALVVAVVGFADDLGKLGVAGKLAGQTVAALVLLVSGVVLRDISQIPVGVLGYVITFVWLIGMTNLVNFMDGLDGLAGGSGAIAALAFAALALTASPDAARLAAALGAGCVGFTVFNMPKARIFMGDVGSEFLGFLLAALAVLAAGEGAHTSFLVMPLLMFHFIFDACFTFSRRLMDGENVTRAHRGHLYQLMNRLGANHLQVSLFHWAIGLAQAVGAYILLSISGIERLLIFVPFLAFEAAYAIVVMQAVRRKSIIPG